MNTWVQILISVLSSTAFLLIVFPFLEKWLFTRLEKSIQHEYDRKLEDYKFAQLQRQKAELVAKLFSRWIKYRGREKKILNKKELIEYYEDLNRMSIELALWLPDIDILNNIMDRLEMKSNAKSVHGLIGDVRKLILNKKDEFDSNKVILWPATNEEIDKLMDSEK